MSWTCFWSPWIAIAVVWTLPEAFGWKMFLETRRTKVGSWPLNGKASFASWYLSLSSDENVSSDISRS